MNNLKKFYVSKLFIEIDGITNELELTVSSINMASLIQEAANNADQKILLLTKDAFEKNSFYRVGKAYEIADRLITNSHIKDVYKNLILIVISNFLLQSMSLKVMCSESLIRIFEYFSFFI